MAEDLFEFEKLKATYIDYWKRYTDTKGVATRYQYWVPTIANAAVMSILSPIIGNLAGLLSLAILVPSICIAIRRLNDLEKPWTYILFALIPVIGWILFIYWMAQPGKSIGAEGASTAIKSEIDKEDEQLAKEASDAQKELDNMLGNSDTAKEDADNAANAAADLDKIISGDVKDDPLAAAIEDAANK